MIRLIRALASRLSHREVNINDSVPSVYLLGISIRYAWSIIRSLKYLPYRNIAAGQFFMEDRVVIRCKSKVSIAPGARLGSSVCVDGYGEVGVSIGRGASIGAYSRLICSGTISSVGKYIKIGDRVGLGEFSRIGGSGGVEIGDDTIIAQYFSAHPENHNYLDKSRRIRDQGTTTAPIVIGPNCWIGAKVTVTAGVTIGEGAVIGSGAVVTSDIPAYCVAAGVPARVLKSY